jgi:putative ABC transport system ATP-binding protein
LTSPTIDKPSPRRLRRRVHCAINSLFGALLGNTELTAAKNVAVPLLINGVGRREALDRARETLSRVGLGERAQALPTELSGGQQQRVAIARALVHEPQLIVCDEPTSALDADTGRTVMELLETIAVGADRGLIIVTHDARILEFADRIAMMDDGRIKSISHAPAASS